MARKDGKRIDSARMKDGDGNWVIVEFRMDIGYSVTVYWADCAALPGWQTPKKPNLDEVRKIAKEEIGKHATVTWEDCLQIGIGATDADDTSLLLPGQKPRRQNYSNEQKYHDKVELMLELQIRPFQRATVGGKPVWRENPKGIAHSGEPGEAWHGGEMEWSIVADTPETRRVLNEIMTSFQMLATRLRGLFTQEQAEKTLLKLAANMPLLLTGPAPEKPSKGRKKEPDDGE